MLIEISSQKRRSTSDTYQLFTSKRTSEHCNDVSLCLRQIDATCESIHPDDRDEELKELVSFAISVCEDFLIKVLQATRRTTLLIISRMAESTGIYETESITSVARSAFAFLADHPQFRKDL